MDKKTKEPKKNSKKVQSRRYTEKKSNNDEKSKNNKSNTRRNIILSLMITAACFLIIVLRLFYPFHRAISVSLFVITWILFIMPILRRIRRKQLRGYPNIKFLRKHYVTIISIIIFVFIVYVLIVIFPIRTTVLENEDADTLRKDLDSDSVYILGVIESLETSYNKLEESGLLELEMKKSNPESLGELKEKFEDIVEHMIILDKAIERYKYFYQINVLKQKELNMKAFIIGYAAYMTKYKTVLKLTQKVEGNQFVKIALNEKMEELKLENAYYLLKTKVNGPNEIVKINTGMAYLKYISSQDMNTSPEFKKLMEYSRETYISTIGEMDQNIRLGIYNVFDSFEENTMQSWLPIQEEVTKFLGTTRISRRQKDFISVEQIEDVKKLLQPGDILLQRRNGYMGNIGIPGFWIHSALYTGTLEELDEYFKDESKRMFNKTMSQHIKEEFPEVFEDKMNRDEDGYKLTTIEGKEKGVTMFSLEKSGKADYMAAIRPKLSKEDKLKALVYAFSNYKKPYDYNFDFSTDDSFVCSELVYKAYSKTDDKKGLEYPLTLVAGRWILSVNDMVKVFADNTGTEKEQNEFVFFLDGDDMSQTARMASIDEFKESWKRPRYSIMER